MNNAYKKECRLAIVAFAIVTFCTHFFPVYFLFPELTKMTWFGWPAHYLLTMLVGWLLLIPLYWIYIQVSEKIDDEIRNSSAGGGTSLDPHAKAASTPTLGGGR